MVAQDMLAGGIETSATLLEWIMSELLLYPRVMKRLQDEVRGFCKGTTTVGEDDLKDMIYLKAVIKEGLRLHPPLPLLLFREPSQDTKVHDYDISAGTQVIINAWAIQRNPAYWEEPEEFKPERFMITSVDIKQGRDFDFIAFGAVRRGCPRMSFAMIKVELALANLVSQFNWKLPGKVQPESFLAETFGTSVHKEILFSSFRLHIPTRRRLKITATSCICCILLFILDQWRILSCCLFWRLKKTCYVRLPSVQIICLLLIEYPLKRIKKKVNKCSGSEGYV
ncbi:cytochrome P450 71A25-like [Silene latifolia]|uniref:cytochrome P450 71A25-like n=1 Tax=Silene latifolia TaxID=37657 RepID=UPI003D76DA3C